ncbi:DUF1963 domain-containing protein [Patulibacter brassicae]|uniref:DUF1963 domain-containing protein n=1 Tax=Patulibacter brassicae TaxID=1705717 RepID=A0ABU4VQ05_9ACTN|nr:DUF1963 domain-containing protein [Patulibacter brassicae]MDX8152986.1 DUF1963 domain-containing protein [Patulibacter brassicae]
MRLRPVLLLTLLLVSGATQQAAAAPVPDDAAERRALGRELRERDLPARASGRLVAAAEWGAFAVRRTGPGTSRIGGRGVLPAGETWPVRRGRPLDFVAIVDLAEVPRFPQRELLPADGTLLFFAALESLWEPTDSGNHAGSALRVWYVPPGTTLRQATRPRATRRAPSDSAPASVPRFPLAWRPRLTLTDSWTARYDRRYRLTRSQSRRYERVTTRWADRWDVPRYGRDDGRSANAILGIPQTAQDDPRGVGQVAVLTVVPWTFGGEFLDGGDVAFVIGRDDLAARRWDRVDAVPSSS